MAMWLSKENGIPLISPFSNCMKNMVWVWGYPMIKSKRLGKPWFKRVCLHSECKKRYFDRTFYALLRCFGYHVPDNTVSKHINDHTNDRYNPLWRFFLIFHAIVKILHNDANLWGLLICAICMIYVKNTQQKRIKMFML